MINAAIAEAFEATWPAAEYRDAGGFCVGRGLGAGGRVSSARVTGNWSDADIDTAIAIHRHWDQTPLFRVEDGDEGLMRALEVRGFGRTQPTTILSCPVEALTDTPVPPITTFAIWPPLAIQREIWSAGNIGPERQAVMPRVETPRAAILGRTKDRAAGAAFVAIHGDVAMVHALEVLPEWRRHGLARWMMREAAFWARDNQAERISLAVTRANSSALALYESLGFVELAGYAYYALD